MEARSAVATIDAVAVRAAADSTDVLLHRRAAAPHRGRWALPGVRLEPGERITQAARRAVGKAGVSATSITGAGQLVVFDEPHSDPRGTALSIGAWVTVDPKFSPIRRNAAIWVQWDAVPDLAFDHNRILTDVRPILAAKLWTDLEFSAGLTGSEFGVPVVNPPNTPAPRGDPAQSGTGLVNPAPIRSDIPPGAVLRAELSAY